MAEKSQRRVARSLFEKAAKHIHKAAGLINQMYPEFKERNLPQAAGIEEVIKSCLLAEKTLEILRDMT